MKVAVVHWRDSAVMASVWRDRRDAMDAAKVSVGVPIISAGLVIDDGDPLLLAVSWNPDPDDLQGAIAIPRLAILEERVVAEVAEDPK